MIHNALFCECLLPGSQFRPRSIDHHQAIVQEHKLHSETEYHEVEISYLMVLTSYLIIYFLYTFMFLYNGPIMTHTRVRN